MLLPEDDLAPESVQAAYSPIARAHASKGRIGTKFTETGRFDRAGSGGGHGCGAIVRLLLSGFASGDEMSRSTPTAIILTATLIASITGFGASAQAAAGAPF